MCGQVPHPRHLQELSEVSELWETKMLRAGAPQGILNLALTIVYGSTKCQSFQSKCTSTMLKPTQGTLSKLVRKLTRWGNNGYIPLTGKPDSMFV